MTNRSGEPHARAIPPAVLTTRRGPRNAWVECQFTVTESPELTQDSPGTPPRGPCRSVPRWSCSPTPRFRRHLSICAGWWRRSLSCPLANGRCQRLLRQNGSRTRTRRTGRPERPERSGQTRSQRHPRCLDLLLIQPLVAFSPLHHIDHREPELQTASLDLDFRYLETRCRSPRSRAFRPEGLRIALIDGFSRRCRRDGDDRWRFFPRRD